MTGDHWFIGKGKTQKAQSRRSIKVRRQEAGNKHHEPKSKLSVRSQSPYRQQKEVVSRDPCGNHLDLSHWDRWNEMGVAGNKEALLQKPGFVHSIKIYI